MTRRPRPATPADLAAIEHLLEACALPFADCAEHLAGFILVDQDDVLAGTGCLQWLDDCALLRSVAVAPRWRSSGIGRLIVRELGERARKAGIRHLYLLTETAQPYFERLGFTPVGREDAPLTVRATRQFRGLCPSTASLMYRALDGVSGGN